MNLSNTNIATSISVVFGFLLLLLLPFDKALIFFELDDFKEKYLGDAIKNLVIVCYGYFLIQRFGYTKVSGVFNFAPRHKKLIIIPLYFVLIGPLQYALFDYEFDHVQLINVLILLGAMITVGLSEEIIFRGFVLPNLIRGTSSDQSLVGPIVLSSLLFGVLHFLNLLNADSYFPLVLSQVIYATMFGVAFGVILLRTGSLLPLGLLHGLINFSSNWDDLPGTFEPAIVETYRMHDAIFSVIIVLPFFLYALKQLPKIDRKAVLSMYKD
ncbi:MAG: CPBP family intramembrane glutamic endopeptidase [Reichenbachiella sp.]|uniref:CPBP family intramembrane glutamic endopeptidase n=1 Tax=Reichenbachiella sp. TaxID=2184521 RepID=UPI003266FE10